MRKCPSQPTKRAKRVPSGAGTHSRTASFHSFAHAPLLSGRPWFSLFAEGRGALRSVPRLLLGAIPLTRPVGPEEAAKKKKKEGRKETKREEKAEKLTRKRGASPFITSGQYTKRLFSTAFFLQSSSGHLSRYSSQTTMALAVVAIVFTCFFSFCWLVCRFPFGR